MKTEINDIAARVVDLLMDVVCVVDLEGNFVYISASCEKVFGYTQAEMLGTNMVNYVHPEDRDKTLAVAGQIMHGKEQPYFENRYLRKDGTTVHIMWAARWSENDKVRVAVARDITEYKRYERIQSSIYKLSQVAHQADDLSELFQRGHHIISQLIAAESYVVAISQPGSNRAKLAHCIDGKYQPKDIIKLSDRSALGEVIRSGRALLVNSVKEFALQQEIEAGCESQDQGNWLGVPLITQDNIIGALVIRTHRADGYSRHDVKLMEFVAEQFALTIERKEYEQRLHHMASHDWLTGLPNRLLFNDRLDVAIKRARRVEEKLALLYMDLDGFKDVNDSLGHAKGDLLLSKVANRIKSCVRESDTIARMGGDEFTVLLTEIHDQDAISMVLEKIKTAVNKPFVLEGNTVNIGISIGVAVFPEQGQEREQLLRVADNAMYDDKYLKSKEKHKINS
ncbi:GGDEF domain-containing protein [Kangiella koreensis]|uniref:Diguanylate cyclase with PAS/PAC and GAF sensors n=1 Tax=Kangiella koreensis (strain DSM 16069 / JCM 12317 / KCTC 12182 / SW-125) TaxID=523791 RepID=C7R6M2_KANKD|nr:GGDEF domain-containing protein [Kangiella koreensis]ACV25538.1 diguanylate cyclase with PAS/PAC and GAF sensors [Kangiella koreensis DSM 16069]